MTAKTLCFIFDRALKFYKKNFFTRNVKLPVFTILMVLNIDYTKNNEKILIQSKKTAKKGFTHNVFNKICKVLKYAPIGQLFL